MIAKDDEDTYYLVLHCSSKQAKESCFGLYPSERVWYKSKIKTIYNEDKTRYLNYIRGDAAVNFIDYANKFRDFNKELHKYVANEFIEITKSALCGTTIIKHHYGMPTPNSISIGTFVVDTNANNDNDLIVPVFSELGKDICLFSVDRNQEKTYTPAGTGKNIILVPHGWGQVIDGIQSISLANIGVDTERKLIIKTDIEHEIPVIPKMRIPLEEKHVRNFKSVESFLNDKCSNINGTVQKILHPVFCYCSRTVKPKNYKLN